jgi:hypothetical protein
MRRLQVNLNRKVVMVVHRRILVGLPSDRSQPGNVQGRQIEGGVHRDDKKGRRSNSRERGRTTEEIMSTRGLKELNVYVVACSSRPGIPTWANDC